MLLVEEPRKLSHPLSERVQKSPTRSWVRRPDRAARCRRIVLWSIAFFILGQLGLSIWLHVSSLGPHDQEYAARIRLLQQRTGPAAGNPATVFALGSSRFQFGLHASHLETTLTPVLGRPVVAINFASPGAGPVTDLFNWRRLQRDGYRPDLVLIEVHPALLNGRLAPSYQLAADVWPTSRFNWSELEFVEKYAGEVRPGLRKEWLWESAFPGYCHRLEYVTSICPHLLPFSSRAQPPALDDSGQVILHDEAWTAERRQYYLNLAHDQYYQGLQDFVLPGQHCEALRELLGSCRQAGVPAVLILTPEGPYFRSLYKASTWPEIRGWMAGAAAEEGAKLVDAREWMAEVDFFDSHHMTVPGANKFTERLALQAVLPLLRKPASVKD